MKKLRRFKTWKAMLALVLLCFMAGETMAQTVNITAAANVSSRGTVTGSGSYTIGEMVTLTATANNGNGFTFWKKVVGNEETIVSYSETFTFEANESGTYKAFFYTEFTGATSQNHGEYALNKDVTLKGQISLSGNLTIYMGGSQGCGNKMIKRGVHWSMFKKEASNNGYYRLSMFGREGDSIVLDGGAVFNIPGDARSGLNTSACDPMSITGYMIWLGDRSSLEMEYVVMQNNFVTDQEGDYGGMILGKQQGANWQDFKMTDCAMRGSLNHRNGSAISFVEDCKFHAYLTRVKVSKCYSMADYPDSEGGTIRCYGGTKSTMDIDNCEICYNKTGERGDGAGICWYAGGMAECYLKITGNTKIHDNESLNTGGGIRTGGRTIIESAEIYNNYAHKNGGGIFIYTYAGPNRGYGGAGINFTMDENVKIYNNTSDQDGGGVCISFYASDYLGFNASWQQVDPECKVEIKNGGQIYGNKARRGGGLCINDELPLKHYASGHGTTLEYTRSVVVSGGEIKNNHAYTNANGNEAYGGAIFIHKHEGIETPTSDFTSYGAGNLTVTIGGGNIHDNTAEAGTGFSGEGYGGAFAIYDEHRENNQYNSTCNVEIKGTPDIYDNSSNKNGGALYLNSANLTINGGIIGKSGHPNKTVGGNGGGICVSNGNLTMNAGSFNYNQAKKVGSDGGNGGGFYVTGGTVNVAGGTISNNLADNFGGGFYVNTTNDTDTTYINGGTTVSNNKATNGGGAYVNKGQLRIDDGATTINTNKATTAGGGIYMVNGTVLFNDATMHADSAQYGGGFYLGNGDVIIKGATISNNVSTAGHGGAFDIANGDLTVGNTSITGNKAPNGNGGGAYVGNGDIVFNAGTSVTYNTAKNGGGLYVGGGSFTYNNGEINHNTATGNGGGIYASADMELNGGTVSENTAKNGGGLYANDGLVDFTSGTFSQNYASVNGGGIYVASDATVQLSGNAVLTKNHVPQSTNLTNGQGGGIYLAGQVKVGRNASDAPGTHSLQVQDNYAGTETWLNNIYLPTDDNVIELLSDLRNSTNTKIGFSVNNGFRKVVYHNNDATTGTASWLHDLVGDAQGLTGVIFDDRQKYMAIHVLNPSDLTFDHNYIYLWGCWISAVDKDPNTHTDEYPLPTGITSHYTVEDGVWHIYTKEGLAWFSSYVNGLNDFEADYDEDVNAAASAVMEADVDMREFLWVPLGSAQSFTPTAGPTSSIFQDGHVFKGNFDGQGYVISGLDCRFINVLHSYGLFGEVVGDANIRNTFVDDYLYNSNYETRAYIMGGIASSASDNTVIRNCEARGFMSSPRSTVSTLGGIVGLLQDNASVHSCIGLPEFDGVATKMGGIAGETGAGTSVMNSFSNSLISTTGNVGGLVGTNAGNVANCYVRLRDEMAPDNFYWFAAVNNGTVESCYARNDAEEDHYIYDGNDVVSCDIYDVTSFMNDKYGYAQQDQMVGDDNLLNVLNGWVSDQPSDFGYATWTRTMASYINSDYPIHAFDDFTNAYSYDTEFVEYKKDVNATVDMYNAYSDGGVIYLYTSDTLRTNTGDNVRIYIGENVGVFAETEDVVTNARVGVTLDNSDGGEMGGAPYDWHMFSTSLKDAPLGITYYDMATHYYGYEVPASTISLDAEGYFPMDTPFGSFDYYCYSEPDYHWINFKRNSNDHWHQDEPHEQIEYNDINNQGESGNEATLIPGKGYMVAIDQETMLMADGQLTNGTVTFKATNSELYSYQESLRGVNLLGNPYQSYLDFDKFVEGNDGKLYGNTYYILDADSSGYLAYTSGSSDNEIGAPGYLHPHQSFFVRVSEAQTLQFTNAMRSVVGNNYSHFRGERPAYPLVNMICTDASGMKDYATIEMGRSDLGGGEKIPLHTGDVSLWFRLDDENWQTVFAPEGLQEAPLRFRAYADGTYTMRWNTANGNFSYLHLIDNLTGVDTDCLRAEEYIFNATTHDYQSRFQLVFDYTGVEEDAETTNSTNFAFQMGDELVVNGEGLLQVYDMNGRLLTERELHGTQSTVSLPRVSQGMYLLRLRSDNQVRVQKMVINK